MEHNFDVYYLPFFNAKCTNIPHNSFNCATITPAGWIMGQHFFAGSWAQYSVINCFWSNSWWAGGRSTSLNTKFEEIAIKNRLAKLGVTMHGKKKNVARNLFLAKIFHSQIQSRAFFTVRNERKQSCILWTREIRIRIEIDRKLRQRKKSVLNQTLAKKNPDLDPTW